MNANIKLDIVNNNITKKRFTYIDILKIIAIFSVVALHCGVWHNDFLKICNVETLFQYAMRLSIEGVPLFMFINGFLIMGKELDLKKNLMKCFKIFFLFLLWAIILIITIAFFKGESLTFIDVVKAILNTKTGSKYTGVLWFLQKLTLIYLFFPVIKLVYDSDFKIYKYLIVLMLIAVFGVNLMVFIIEVLNTLIHNEILNSIISFINQFKIIIVDNIYLVYFLFGGYVYKNKEKFIKNRYIIIGIISTVIVIILGIIASKITMKLYSNYNYDQIFLLGTVLGLFCLASKIEIKNEYFKKFISSIGSNTMGIYLIHTIVIFIINKFFIINQQSFFIRILMLILIVLISWTISLFIRKLPKISFIVKL